jgi:pyruvate dehydrogenase E1 component alpha subunit
MTKDAVARARAREGPTLIEAKTYRFDEHCRNLHVPIPYRSDAEVDHFKANRDPIILYRTRLLERGHEEPSLTAVEEEVKLLVSEAIQFAQDSPLPKLDDVYQNMFSDPIHYPPHDAAGGRA